MDSNERQQMERWAEHGDHAGATDLIDRLTTSLTTPTTTLVPDPGSRGVQGRTLRGLAIATGSAALTIILIVVGVLALRPGSSDDLAPAEVIPRPVEVATTIPPIEDIEGTSDTRPAEPEAPPLVDLTVWSEIPLPFEVFGYEPVYDAEWIDGMLYAVGSSNDVEGELSSFRATVWRSPDGMAWERSATVAEPGGIMHAIAGHGTQLVGVGQIWLDRPDGAIWTSSDGEAWTRVPHDDAVFGAGFSLIHEITIGGPGFVAVGQSCDDPDEPCAGRPTVWVSDTGATWTRLAFLSDTAGVIEDITSHDGVLYAVGSISSEAGDIAAIWTSSDGHAWKRIVNTDLFDGPGNQWITSVASSETGIAAVGSSWTPDGVTEAVVWFSNDGESWTTTGWAVSDPSSNMYFEAVTAVGGQFIAIGSDATNIGPDNDDKIPDSGSLWTSDDGLLWTRIDTARLFVTADLMVVVGNSGGAFTFGGDPELSIWHAGTN